MKIRHQPRRVPVYELPSLAAASCRIGLFARSVRLDRGFRDLPSCFSRMVASTNRPHPLPASSAHAQRSASKSLSIAFVRKELAVTLIMAALPATTSTRPIIDEASVEHRSTNGAVHLQSDKPVQLDRVLHRQFFGELVE
jgi:hypothetical protein